MYVDREHEPRTVLGSRDGVKDGFGQVFTRPTQTFHRRANARQGRNPGLRAYEALTRISTTQAAAETLRFHGYGDV